MPTGPRIYNFFPLLAGPVAAWPEHLPRIAQMGFDWIFLNPIQQPGFSGSLYAIQDPYALHPLIRGDATGPAQELLRDFADRAADHGISIMLDLVINHTARDALLVDSHPDWYVRDSDGGLYSPRAVNPDDPEDVTIWGDLAELDYRDSVDRAGLTAYWSSFVTWCLDAGVRGFRCDAAYQVPSEVWRPLIDSAQAHTPGCMFAAETLGCTPEQVEALAGAGFDYLFNSSKWWDFEADWLFDQYDLYRRIAPTIAFPESHDTDRLINELDTDDPDLIGRWYRRAYLFAATFSTGVMIPIGFEYGFAEPLHVVDSRPADWRREVERRRADLTQFIAAVNAMRSDVPALNAEGPQYRLTEPEDDVVALLRLDADDDDARHAALVLINRSDSDVSASLDELIGSVGVPLGDFADVTPDGPLPAATATEPVELAPLGMRVFRAGIEGR